MAYVHTITTRRIHWENPFIRIVWFIFSIVEVILLFRFALKLLGANVGASFTQFVYSLSHPFVSPFLFVVPSPQVEVGLIEWSTLIALVTYWILAWGITEIFSVSRPGEKVETREEVKREDVSG